MSLDYMSICLWKRHNSLSFCVELVTGMVSKNIHFLTSCVQILIKCASSFICFHMAEIVGPPT